jgi:putative Mg2+ transporter-C (MgtC) family protein
VDWSRVDWLGDFAELGRIALAMALGGVVGADREHANKPAGLRTHMLLAGASAILTAAGIGMVHTFSRIPNEGGWLRLDPILVVQAVATAVGFIGAGTILHRDAEHVEGLTTAASLLLVAAIGVAIASGRLVLGVGGTALAMLTLRVVRMIEARLRVKAPTRSP